MNWIEILLLGVYLIGIIAAMNFVIQAWSDSTPKERLALTLGALFWPVTTIILMVCICL